ncbi:unnamed protein product [Ranitomeya imitator]|uniref:Uncharacterized protein n=1 Tax=Ranitomeya imitator TaxID=111125 RepID=A0ABN9M4K3_9NEOB|nr:unnamed protein product [Ranitomeya imitator]
MNQHGERSISVSSMSSSGELSDSSMMTTRFGKQKRKWDRRPGNNKRQATVDEKNKYTKVYGPFYIKLDYGIYPSRTSDF